MVFLMRFWVALHMKASLYQDFFFMLVQVAALYEAGAQVCRRLEEQDFSCIWLISKKNI